ncbi:hypothetical protein KC19_9G050900 [Ceratodon purpureus]|uniref:S-protein homolog n=1 Tax=Ceratodon purpureus TaxID=3225 RepID=A0A8T0GNW4_CERPU|nr:hypothetical protein KC19_9G050900 [Ceratodon purpureus]
MANLINRFPILCLTLVFLVVMESTTMASCSSGVASVYIFNRIKSPIQVQCWNKDGSMIIKPTFLHKDEHVGLVFTPGFWGTTRVNCDFTWIAVDQHQIYIQTFDVWFDSFFLFWQEPPCRQCTWLIHPWGFTEYKDGELGPVVAHYPWIPQE